MVDPVHIGVWGTCVTTPIVKDYYADVRIRTDLHNFSNTGDTLELVPRIFTPEGREALRDTVGAFFPAGASKTLENNLSLSDPLLWDVEAPHLYELRSEVYADDQLRDTYNTTFGIRTIRFTADEGFYLNDRKLQLKGVNLHHGNGPFGAAFHTRAMERQLEIMQAMGVNTIRNSHNIAAPELLELCDRKGLLFFNEVFDKYDAKAGITDTTNFESFTHLNIRNFVVRDRNHPSVFLWSVENEIWDVQWNINGRFHRLHTMLNYLEKYDPTQLNTLVCDNLQSAVLRNFDYYDVHA